MTSPRCSRTFSAVVAARPAQISQAMGVDGPRSGREIDARVVGEIGELQAGRGQAQHEAKGLFAFVVAFQAEVILEAHAVRQ